jgi:hypothetical protein
MFAPCTGWPNEIPFHNSKSEIEVQELNWNYMGHVLYSTITCINILIHIGGKTRKKWPRTLLYQTVKFY